MQNESTSGNFQNRLLWGASSVLTLGIVSKFAASFRRCHHEKVNTQVNFAALLRSAKQKIQSVETITSLREDEPDPLKDTILMLLRQQIYDYLHEVHQELLENEVDQIIEIIPLIDKLMRFWHPDRSHTKDDAEIEHYHIVLLNLEQKMKQNNLI